MGTQEMVQVAVSALKPNPFRRLDEYPIQREKVDTLRESYQATGFWGNILVRAVGKSYQIAYGHHRLIALQEEYGPHEMVDVIVRDLSNEHMIQIMARENMEEWGTSAWIELETVRAVLDAHEKGEIDLLGSQKPVTAGSSYMKPAVARFLGWTRKAHGDGTQPNFACEVAFKALEMLDKGFIREADLRGLSRKQMGELINAQWSIYQANMRVASVSRKEAVAAQERAASETDTRKRSRFEKQAEVHEAQAKQLEVKAEVDAKQFGREGAQLLRNGQSSVRDIRVRADRLKPSVAPTKVYQIDAIVNKTVDALERIAADDTISANMKIILEFVSDASPEAKESLERAFEGASSRLAKFRQRLTR